MHRLSRHFTLKLHRASTIVRFRAKDARFFIHVNSFFFTHFGISIVWKIRSLCLRCADVDRIFGN